MQSWRDCDAWRHENLSMNTTSNEAAKLYDCSLSQLVRWREDPAYGGLDTSLAQMLNADPTFVMGHVLKCGIDLIGQPLPHYSQSSAPLELLLAHADQQSPNLTKREMLSVEAIKELSLGNVDKACDIWERILIEHPRDMLALKFAHDTYFYTGAAAQMRDSCARVLPRWRTYDPLFSFVHGMHSFGLVQSNQHEFARKSALLALDLNPQDAWATHTLCHYNEYRNDTNTGISMLRDSEANWSPANLLSTHNYWHWCLYLLERGEHDQALALYDRHVTEYLSLNRVMDMVDIVSLLYRLQLDGCPVSKERWLKLKKVYSTRLRDHGYTFNDSHVLMILSACGSMDEKEEFFSSLDEHLKQDLVGRNSTNNINNNNSGGGGDFTRDACNNVVFDQKNLGSYLRHVNRKLGVNLYHAICYFDSGDYAQVVELLNPIKYDLFKIGGSNAQRDLFHQMLTQAALRSSFHWHNQLGLALINERFALKPDSRLTKRLADRFAIAHHHHFD